MANVQTIFFDLDGTLIDHFRAIHRCYNHILREFSLPECAYGELKKRIGPPLSVTVAETIGGKDRDLIDRFCKRFRTLMQETFRDGLEEMPGATWLLNGLRLRGYRLAIFTNKQRRTVEAIAAHLGFDRFLDGIIATEEGMNCPRKPEIAFSRHALEVLHTTGEWATMVGDSEVDMLAAAAGNFRACYAVATGTHGAEELRKLGMPRESIFQDLHHLGEAIFKIFR
jgi:phosphoglycolate phosphatase